MGSLAKLKNAEKIVFCISAASKYGIIVHLGHVGFDGWGATTGNQKSNAVPKKHPCSMACHASLSNAS